MNVSFMMSILLCWGLPTPTSCSPPDGPAWIPVPDPGLLPRPAPPFLLSCRTKLRSSALAVGNSGRGGGGPASSQTLDSERVQQAGFYLPHCKSEKNINQYGSVQELSSNFGYLKSFKTLAGIWFGLFKFGLV